MRQRRRGDWAEGHRPPPPEGGGGEPRRDPPPCPPIPPDQPAGHGAAGPTPLRGRGDGSPSPRQDRSAQEGGQSRARLHAPAACSRRNRDGQANPRQHARAPHGPRPGTANDHESERYGGHVLHGQSDAKDTRFVACPGKAEGRTEARRSPAPLAPPAALSGRTARRPPPPQPHLPALERPRRADPPHGERTALSQVRAKRDQAAPPPPSKPNGARDRDWTRRGAQTAWNGPTSAQHRDRARCARHANQGRRGGCGRRGSASAHTHKGHAGKTRRATGPSPQNAQTAWSGVPVSGDKRHPDTTARHTQRWKRGAGRGKRGRHNTRHQPQPPEPAARAAHTQPGHCTRQGSSGAPRHAPAPRLGSLRVSPRGSHWRQGSSTGPAAPVLGATRHQGGDAVGKRLQLRLLSDALTGEWRNGDAGEGQGSEPREPGALCHQAGSVSSRAPH